ncbi:hypothetical protein V8G57_00610 [Collimonas sp. H4R21]|jgi:hypothetical protein|uniref:Uncharacterized protein n=1 Tax=Collimonas rhizosphaerae TaxID=3126357 RepID=A0ABU9PPE8_9BURK|nr:hypothetical protein [Collimonas sp. OK412]SFD35104.1 hypothetical protein SAMN04515619_14317 [Collimonas sp. OK412]
MNGSRNAADPAAAEDYRTPPELLISAVLHLISQYNMHTLANDACVQSARTIERHLRTLSDWPELAPVLRATCQQLSEQWTSVIERALPKQKNERSAFITRLISGTRAL